MSRQSCRRNLVRLRLHRSYTMRELAELLEVHIRTVQGWHKNGLMAIDDCDRPLLFIGQSVIEFLKGRRSSGRCMLQSDQCYCLRCRKGVSPIASTVSLELTKKRVGRSDRLIIIKGICPHCSGKVVRLATTKSVKKTIWGGDTITGGLTIDGSLEA